MFFFCYGNKTLPSCEAISVICHFTASCQTRAWFVQMLLGGENPLNILAFIISLCTVMFPYSDGRKPGENCFVVSVGQYCHVLCVYKMFWEELKNKLVN